MRSRGRSASIGKELNASDVGPAVSDLLALPAVVVLEADGRLLGAALLDLLVLHDHGALGVQEDLEAVGRGRSAAAVRDLDVRDDHLVGVAGSVDARGGATAGRVEIGPEHSNERVDSRAADVTALGGDNKRVAERVVVSGTEGEVTVGADGDLDGLQEEEEGE